MLALILSLMVTNFHTMEPVLVHLIVVKPHHPPVVWNEKPVTKEEVEILLPEIYKGDPYYTGRTELMTPLERGGFPEFRQAVSLSTRWWYGKDSYLSSSLQGKGLGLLSTIRTRRFDSTVVIEVTYNPKL